MATQQVAWLLLLSILLVITDIRASSSSSANDSANGSYGSERRLRIDLFSQDGYSVKDTPSNVSGQPVHVYISLTMYALISLEEKEQLLTGASWLIIRWEDYRVRWDPEDYGNLRYLSLAMDEIWTPKILLTNTASEKMENPIPESVFRALVSWEGTVTLEGPVIHKTSCPMDLSQFPFDQQNCPLIFATQNMPDCIVKLKLGTTLSIISDVYSQWRPLNLSGKESVQVVKFSADHERAYSIITFYFSVERLPNHYILNVALPSGLLTLISLGVFWLSIESGERISMSVSLMLGQAVFWLVVAESLPPSGSQGTPLLINCIEVNFVVGGLAIILSVITVGVQHQSGPLKNRFLRKLFLHTLPLIVCARPVRGRKVGDVQNKSGGQFAAVPASMKSVKGLPEGESELTKPSTHGKLSVIFDVDGSRDQKENATGPQNGSDEMKFVAVVLDRIFFIVTAIIFTSGNVMMIVKSISTAW